MGKKIILISFEVLFISLCLFLVLQSTSLFIYATDWAKTIIDIQNVKAFFELGNNDELAAIYLQEIIDEINKVIDFIINIDLEKIGEVLLILWDLLLDLIIYFCNFGLNIVLIVGII